ncbi:thioredoxin [Planctomycetales bacterium]|nr:thioredoxin [Planctomycetales bacterium]GHT34333.1 thioredoxin [Planctomycetales bacterium]
MSELVKILSSEEEFNTLLESGVVLVDFFATWCGPCRMQSPILEEVASGIKEKATIVKVDSDKFQTLAAKYQVASIPTLIIFKDGQIFNRFVGLQQAANLIPALEKAAG